MCRDLKAVVEVSVEVSVEVQCQTAIALAPEQAFRLSILHPGSSIYFPLDLLPLSELPLTRTVRWYGCDETNQVQKPKVAQVELRVDGEWKVVGTALEDTVDGQLRFNLRLDTLHVACEAPATPQQ